MYLVSLVWNASLKKNDPLFFFLPGLPWFLIPLYITNQCDNDEDKGKVMVMVMVTSKYHVFQK